MGKYKKQTYPRRMFLKGMGGFTLAIPLLPSLLPREAWGQSPAVIKRYFSMVGNYDYGHHQNWFPTLNELPLVGSSGTDLSYRYQRLNTFLPQTNSMLSPIFGNRLNPFVNKMNLFRGLNLHTRIGHGQGHMLGNIAATDGHDTTVTALKRLPTIDQVLAANRRFTPHSNDPLILGEAWSFLRDQNGTVQRASGRWPKPHQLFDQLFTRGGVPIPESGGSSQAHPRRDALSRVLEDYQRIRRGRHISSEDAQVLDNALDRFSDIQSRLGSNQTTTGCSYSSIDGNRTRNDGVSFGHQYNPEQHAYAYDLFAKIFVAAASCDLHRVFDFHTGMLDHYFDRHNTEDFHQGHSHQPWAQVASNGNKINHAYMGEIWRLFIDGFLVPLVSGLDQVIEANGRSALDNSLVHLTLECSTVHSDMNKPCLLIGSANGAITTGHLIDYSRRELGPHVNQGDNFEPDPSNPRFGHCYHGAHYNRSLTTILRALGLNPNEYEDPEINLFFQNRMDGLLGAHNNGVARVGGYGHIGASTSGVWYYTNQQMYSQEYARTNYHHYKDPLPMPGSNAA